MEDQRGITLVELLVTIGIMGVVLSMIFTFVKDSLDFQERSVERAAVNEACKNALGDVEASTIGMIESESGAFPLVSAGADDMSFYSDIDLDDTVEKVRIYRQGINLVREITEPVGESYPGTPTKTENICTYMNLSPTDDVFIYYGDDYTGNENPLSEPVSVPDVRVVKIVLECEVDPELDPNADYFYSTFVKLRNLESQ